MANDTYEMVVPMHEAAKDYIPHLSIGHENDIRMYGVWDVAW
jgi:hypothetical protein